MRTLSVVSILFLIIFVTGCASESTSEFNRNSVSDSTSTVEYDQEASTQSNKFVRTLEIFLYVEKREIAASQIRSLTTQYGGYVAYFDFFESFLIDIDVVVPSKNLDNFLNDLAQIGEIDEWTENTKDVSKQNADLEAKLINLIALRDRLKILLEKADNTTDVLDIESELNRVQGEIDTLESRLSKVKDSVAMTKIEIDVDQRIVWGPLGAIVVIPLKVIWKMFIFEW